jgi:hypothetical protein
VVSISTTRETPSAFGLSHLVVGATGAGAAAGAAAIGAAAGACAFCAQTLVATDTEIARTIAKPLRITFSILKSPSFIFIAALNYQVNVMLGYHRNANIYWSGMVKVSVWRKNIALPRPVLSLI